MGSDADFLEYVLERIGLGEEMSARKMFGEYALYLDGKVVALVCDNRLMLKPSSAAESLPAELPWEPPYPGAKPFPRLDELMEDGVDLKPLFRATANALPPPKPKRPRKKKATPK